MRAGRSFLPAGAILATALILAAAACGGGSNGTTSTEGSASPTAWASGVCTAFSSWSAGIQQIKSSLHTSHTSTDLKNAASQVKNEVAKLRSTLLALGKPNTASSQQAKEQVNSFEASLSQSKTTIDNTLATRPANVSQALAEVSTVTGEAAKVTQNFKLFIGNLKKLDPKSELSQAFQNAPACSAYVKS